MNFARNLKTKVDAIVSGHSHSLINTDVNGIPIVQARNVGRAIDVLDIALDTSINVPVRHEVRELASDTLRADPAIDSIVQRAVARVAPIVNRHVGPELREPRRHRMAEATSRSGHERHLSLQGIVFVCHLIGSRNIDER